MYIQPVNILGNTYYVPIDLITYSTFISKQRTRLMYEGNRQIVLPGNFIILNYDIVDIHVCILIWRCDNS